MSLIGTTVGSIRILEALGKGGMGEVYVGWDETLERKVALKAIRGERRLDAEAKARFLREARVLSQLDHPGICRIHGLEEGPDSDFLVLELIPGRSLYHALREGLDFPFRLYIAEKIAEALAAAHAKGVIHRDLKPENVMITPDGQVKVLDFGLAHEIRNPTDPDPAEVSPPPGAWVEPTVGPEPTSDPHGLAPTVAAVSGTAPTMTSIPSGGKATPPGDDPRRPQESLSRTEPESPVHGDAVRRQSIFETRGGMVMGTLAYMSPEQARGERGSAASDVYSLGLMLQEMVTGESAYDRDLPPLELLLKVAEGRSRNPPPGRLDSDLARLVERTKSISPEARPPAIDVAERLWWIRGKRRRTLQRAMVAIGFALLLLGGIKYALDLRHERALAVAARLEAEQVTDFLLGVFSVADPRVAQGREVSARELLDAGSARLDSLAEQPGLHARMLFTIGRVYRQLGHFERARPLLERAVDIRESLGDDPDLADSLELLASLHHDLGHPREAEALYLRALELLADRYQADHPRIATTSNNLATLYRSTGRLDEATALFEKALLALRRAHGNAHPDIARTLNNIGEIHLAAGRLDDAESAISEAIDLFEAELGADHPDSTTGLNNLAMLRQEQGRLDDAGSIYSRILDISETVLGADHPKVAVLSNNLAGLRRSQGKLAEAQTFYRKALDIQESTLGSEHPSTAVTLANFGGLELDLGRTDRAAALYGKALAIQRRPIGNDATDLAITLGRLAELEVERERDSAAEATFVESLERLGADSSTPLALAPSIGLARLWIRNGRADRAEPLLISAAAIAEGSAEGKPPGHRARGRLASVHLAMAERDRALGDAASAESTLRRALEGLVPPDSDGVDLGRVVVIDLDSRLRALVMLDRLDEARVLAEALRSRGWQRPSFVRLCRDHGLVEPASDVLLTHNSPSPSS